METKQADNGLLAVKNIVKHFDISGGLLDQLTFEGGRVTRRRTTVKALNDVSFTILPGETFSVVGESGCGKSTLARTTVGIYPPDSGEIRFRGERVDHLSAQEMLPYRAKMQMIFQDPYASLNPRMTVKQTLEEPVVFHKRNITRSETADRVAEVMRQVGVDPKWAARYPHEFSGGQRQRISIARALMVDPEFIVADEPVSALDVSIQAQIINLLVRLQEELQLSYLFVSHDLAVVEHISDRVAIMYLGKIVEVSPSQEIYREPRHPYTQSLLSAIPIPDPKSEIERTLLQGDIPNPASPPSGCSFRTRCPLAKKICSEHEPEMIEVGEEHFTACHMI